MVRKVYSTFPKSSRLELCYQMVWCHIQDTHWRGRSDSCTEIQSMYFTTSADWATRFNTKKVLRQINDYNSALLKEKGTNRYKSFFLKSGKCSNTDQQSTIKLKINKLFSHLILAPLLKGSRIEDGKIQSLEWNMPVKIFFTELLKGISSILMKARRVQLGRDQLCLCCTEWGSETTPKQQSSRQIQTSRREADPNGTKWLAKYSEVAENLQSAEMHQTEVQSKLKELTTNKEKSCEIIKEKKSTKTTAVPSPDMDMGNVHRMFIYI